MSFIGAAIGDLYVFMRSHQTGKIFNLKKKSRSGLPCLSFSLKDFFSVSCRVGDSFLIMDEMFGLVFRKCVRAEGGLDEFLEKLETVWGEGVEGISELLENIWKESRSEGFFFFFFFFFFFVLIFFFFFFFFGFYSVILIHYPSHSSQSPPLFTRPRFLPLFQSYPKPLPPPHPPPFSQF